MRFGDLFLFPPDLWADSEREDLTFLDDDASGDRDVLISSEYIAGGVACPQPWIPDREEEYGPIVREKRETGGRPDHTSFGSHLDALVKTVRRLGFSQVKVFLTIRRQDEKLASGYAEASNRVRGASQENFERWVRNITGDRDGFHFGGGQKLDYFRWWETVSEVLGKSNVLFLPFELLRENQGAFLARWLKFIGVEDSSFIANSLSQTEEMNRRSTSKSNWSIRDPIRTGPNLRPSRVFQALRLPSTLPARWPDFQRGEKIQLTKELSDEILEPYEEGNRRLDNQGLGLNLKKYGYY